EEENWQPDVDDIRKKITDRTKAIVIINPNNPTGALYPKNTIKEIVDIAAENDIAVISDEIYDDIVFEKRQYATASLAKDAPIITFNGFSKVYLVPGWRMGYAIFNNVDGKLDRIKDAFLRIARARLCANSVCQRAMIAALDGPQDHIPEMVKKLKERSNFAYKRLNEIEGISSTKPDGAFYIFPKVEAIDSWKNDKEFVLDVLNKAHVLLVHGSGFSPEYGKNHFRAVTLPPMEMLEEAFNRLESFMKGIK
ncbi:MAG TPA: aminotransferase class I/II-fold pyridoxal phosphate-dependent enzyme, partial [Thermoplasmatales archaeon]|nr:aminotransferase class I/II-fold pyridoxal phosphate-dependent enzyme [Thermoplasmatales archaeon]